MGNWREDTQSWLTRWYAKGRGGVVDESEYTAYGVTRTVFWYEQDSPRAGDYSPIGTILMNRTPPAGISEDVRDYVFLHEVGHDELNTLLRLLYWPTILLTGLLAFAAILALPINLLKAASLWTTPVSAIIPGVLDLLFSQSLCSGHRYLLG